MRVDEKTKEVIQEWSLTNIKRWAASPKSFTLVGASTGPLCLFPTGAPVVGFSHSSPSVSCCSMGHSLALLWQTSPSGSFGGWHSGA